MNNQRNFLSKELRTGKGKSAYGEYHPAQQTDAGSPSPTQDSSCIFWRDF
jgi:hypothetical protein